ncbi:hypothetical protein DX116_06430 [Aeromicrobium endophyticum]|uniref:Uncharacterized protein n=2 Tax=Aeromicrobium endophyticum TaxID=2292704 RepID=A0A371PBA0_9ACTN|nr:hypothetical protein DX116_06430 [Aeromicrobium endophyticum]
MRMCHGAHLAEPCEVAAMDVCAVVALVSGALLLLAIRQDRAPLGLRALGVVMFGGGFVVLAVDLLGG